MTYAEVVVNSPASRVGTTFHYAVPSGLDIRVGQLVLVPFGSYRLQGIVLAITPTSPVEIVKEILGVLDPSPVLTEAQIALARWIVDYYCCSPLDAVSLMLPPGIKRKIITTIALNEQAVIPNDLSEKQRMLLTLLHNKGRLRLEKVRSASHWKDFNSVLRPLIRRGLIIRDWELEKPKVHVKRQKVVRLIVADEYLDEILTQLKRAPRMVEALCFLQDKRSSVVQRKDMDEKDRMTFIPVSELYSETGCDGRVLGALLQRGLVEVQEQVVRRDPLAQRSFRLAPAPSLTAAQAQVWQEIERGMLRRESTVYLLHGVTGAGKTELYLRALEATLQQGKQAIVLVPEIALTPQTIHRFATRFPGALAVLHSKLSLGEHYDEWQRIRDGLVSVVIGSRSAVFAPLPDLGLIILDEEHEWSYKQDRMPRYHARDVAIKLGQLTGTKVILGSATPDVVSYYRAEQGFYHLLRLPERVGVMSATAVPEGDKVGVVIDPHAYLPPVHVIDMRQELRAGNRGIFSRALLEALSSALEAGEQAILFLNRRGSATFIMCRDCGHVLKCKRCDTSLVYHAVGEALVCHQCNYHTAVPNTCPQCRSSRIKFFGIGTQRVEEEVRRLFPQSRLLRWDRDVTRGKLAHEQILYRFVRHEADILIGTQMIAKGLDLPLVTLVGVINADTALHLPDFKAAERTFQILTQVAGRAGRGALGGRVIIQTYTPNHYSIQAASRHAYEAFYQQEMHFRQKQHYPPYSQLARLIYASSSHNRAQEQSERFREVLLQQINCLGLSGIEVIGPAPAYRRKLRGKHRWQLVLCGPVIQSLLRSVTIPLGWMVDIDPVTML
ncbi:MAG: primosomal protein N' [Chloroflexi bacterium]|nr:primosomal protein N' [Chloroflexota bacterium]MCL5075006.1 primosomal protein N' [Chloroflexota bacterium]